MFENRTRPRNAGTRNPRGSARPRSARGARSGTTPKHTCLHTFFCATNLKIFAESLKIYLKSGGNDPAVLMPDMDEVGVRILAGEVVSEANHTRPFIHKIVLLTYSHYFFVNCFSRKCNSFYEKRYMADQEAGWLTILAMCVRT